MEETVAREIAADCHSQHYTQRQLNATLAKAKKPLEMKIQAKLEDRLALLRRELEELRATKVSSPVKAEPTVSELGDDDNDDDNDVTALEGKEQEEQYNNSSRAPADTW